MHNLCFGGVGVGMGRRTLCQRRRKVIARKLTRNLIKNKLQNICGLVAPQSSHFIHHYKPSFSQKSSNWGSKIIISKLVTSQRSLLYTSSEQRFKKTKWKCAAPKKTQTWSQYFFPEQREGGKSTAKMISESHQSGLFIWSTALRSGSWADTRVRSLWTATHISLFHIPCSCCLSHTAHDWSHSETEVF